MYTVLESTRLDGQMTPELLITLPDGKTELPARLIINKMGSSIHLDLKAELSLSSKPEEKKEEGKSIIRTTEIKA